MTWISVKDRLPEKNQRVLLIINGIIYVGWCTDIYSWAQSDLIWETEHYDEYPLEYNNQGGAYKNEVTHWMLLPEPPKEVNS